MCRHAKQAFSMSDIDKNHADKAKSVDSNFLSISYESFLESVVLGEIGSGSRGVFGGEREENMRLLRKREIGGD